jgi:enoyl-CoA hydratase/carnithine racemase
MFDTQNMNDAMNALMLQHRDARGVDAHLNPRSFNALSEEMLDALQQALDEVAKDDDARAVVLGAAGKAFCPGHNLKEMVATPELAYYQRCLPSAAA